MELKTPTYSHKIKVFMYTETRHFSGFVSRYGREYPGTQRTATVLLIKVPHLHLMNRHTHTL